MSNFLNSTLQKQITRGDVNYCIAGAGNLFEVSDKNLTAIETGNYSCYLHYEISVSRTILLNIYEDVTSFVSSVPHTIYNMRRDTAVSVSTTVDTASSKVGGSIIWGYLLPNGEVPVNSPLNIEAGLLLKPNTIYIYEVDNLGTSPTSMVVNMFLREI